MKLIGNKVSPLYMRLKHTNTHTPTVFRYANDTKTLMVFLVTINQPSAADAGVHHWVIAN